MDRVVEAVKKAKEEWDEAYGRTKSTVDSIEAYGKWARGSDSGQKDSLPRLNGIAQDGLALLVSLQFNLELFAPQIPLTVRSSPPRLCSNRGNRKSTGRTKSGMTSAAESITESLRRTHQLMVQEVEEVQALLRLLRNLL